MKKGWEYKKLGDVCKTYSGGTPLKNVKEYYDNGNIPWLRSGEVCKKYISETEMFITQKGLENSSAKYFPIDTVVVAMYGATAAQVGILKIETTSNQAVCGILPNSKFQPEFLYYFFCYRKDFLASQAQGGAQPNISQVKIKNLQIPVPPLTEQQSIVSYLDAAFAKIDAMKANAEKALSEAKALFQASLKEMLTPKKGWEEKKLGEIISHLRTGLNPRTHFKLNTPDAECFYITVRELKGFSIEPDEKTDKVNSAAIKRINERSNLKIGDVLFSGTGTIGKTALVSELPENWNIKEGVYAMTPKHTELDSKYFIYYISSEFFLLLVNDKAAGTGVRSIPMKELVKLPISLPSLTEQQSIVSTLDSLKSKVDRLQANYEKISAECDALKQAILKLVFE